MQLLKRVGHPLDEKTLLGPVHNQQAVDNYLKAIEAVKKAGGTVLVGGKQIDRPGFFVEPTIVTNIAPDHPLVKTETFAPIVYVLKAKNLDQVSYL